MIFFGILALIVTVNAQLTPWGRTFIADEDDKDEQHTLSLFQNGSYYYTINSKYAGLKDEGYAQVWYAKDEKYDAKTRTWSATFNLTKGFVDDDGNIAFKVTAVFNADFTKSVTGTTWLDIGQNGEVSKTYNEDAGYYTQVSS